MDFDYTQFYCHECRFCSYDVFGGCICLAKGIVTSDYNKACADFDLPYETDENGVTLLKTI